MKDLFGRLWPGCAAVGLVFALGGKAAAGPDDYGRFSFFEVGIDRNAEDEPRNCMISYDGFEDNSTISVVPDWKKGNLVLLLHDPAWDLPDGVDGSIVIDSGDYTERVRIYDNTRSFVFARIRDWRGFRDAFVNHYEMTIQTPDIDWPMDLENSTNAWRAFGRCLSDLRDRDDAGSKSNPWGNGRSSRSTDPWP